MFQRTQCSEGPGCPTPLDLIIKKNIKCSHFFFYQSGWLWFFFSWTFYFICHVIAHSLKLFISPWTPIESSSQLLIQSSACCCTWLKLRFIVQIIGLTLCHFTVKLQASSPIHHKVVSSTTMERKEIQRKKLCWHSSAMLKACSVFFVFFEALVLNEILNNEFGQLQKMLNAIFY